MSKLYNIKTEFVLFLISSNGLCENRFVHTLLLVSNHLLQVSIHLLPASNRLLPASRRADSMKRKLNSFSEAEVQSVPADDENFAITSLFARGDTPGRVIETKFPY